MNTKGLIKIIIYTCFFILGSTSTAASKNTLFKLFPNNYFTTYNISIKLSGSDNFGNSYSGGIIEKTLAKTTFLGKTAIPVQTIMSFVMSSGYGMATLNNYYSPKVKDKHFLGVSGDLDTVTANTSAIPNTAKIGSSGTVGEYIDKRNFKTLLTWRLEDGGSNKAKLILINKTYKPSGVLDNTFTTTYLIKSNGKRLSVEYETFNVNVNVKVTLKGTY